MVPSHQRPRARRTDPATAPTRLADQTQFIRDALPTLRERLLILGELLLTTPADAHSTLHNRLAAALHQRGHLAQKYYLHTIDPLIASRVLAHVSAHTGVDIPSLTTPSVGSHAPPAVTHARLLATRLLRRTALPSYTAIAARRSAATATTSPTTTAATDDALKHNPHLAAEVDHLAQAIDRLANTRADTTQHSRTTNACATSRSRSEERCSRAARPSHGDRHRATAPASRSAEITPTSPAHEIADIHDVKDARTAFAHATVARHRRTDPDFEHRYRQLLREARRVRRQAGYENANLRRGLTSQPAATDSTQTLTEN